MSPLVHSSRPAVARRTLLAGAGIGVLGLASCLEEDGDAPAGAQSATPAAAPVVKVVEFVNAYGETTIWAMEYDLPEDAEAPELYSAQTQAARHEALQAKKAEREWTFEDPLLVVDPYGTTRTGMYVHFTGAPEGGTLTARATAAATPDLSRAITDHGAEGEFEGLVMALVPGAHSELRLTWDAAGGGPREVVATLKAPSPTSGYSSQLAAEVADPAAIAPGLFALSGVSNHTENTFLFDAHGVLRGEFASTDHSSHHFRVEDGRLVITTGARQVSVIDPLGHARTIIDLGEHLAHHDLDVVGGTAYVLTSETGADEVMDRVVRVDLESGEVVETVNLTELLAAYQEITHEQDEVGGGSTAVGKDWIHLNSIDVAKGIMYVSARETSTIIALDGALDAEEETSIRWMIGVEGLWEGTGYEEHFLPLDGEARPSAGQHTVSRIDDEDLPAGRYYLEMFDNNFWSLTTRDPEEWEPLQPEGSSLSDLEGVSYALRYLVDEEAGTVTEDARTEVSYSSVVSSVQRLGAGRITDPFVVNAGRANVFTEHTADGEVLGTYRYDTPTLGYRVYKDSFEGFWYDAA